MPLDGPILTMRAIRRFRHVPRKLCTREVLDDKPNRRQTRARKPFSYIPPDGCNSMAFSAYDRKAPKSCRSDDFSAAAVDEHSGHIHAPDLLCVPNSQHGDELEGETPLFFAIDTILLVPSRCRTFTFHCKFHCPGIYVS